MSKEPKIASLEYFYNTSKKRDGINLIFFRLDKIKLFYRLILARHAQITQNNKFAKSFDVSRKK